MTYWYFCIVLFIHYFCHSGFLIDSLPTTTYTYNIIVTMVHYILHWHSIIIIIIDGFVVKYLLRIRKLIVWLASSPTVVTFCTIADIYIYIFNMIQTVQINIKLFYFISKKKRNSIRYNMISFFSEQIFQDTLEMKKYPKTKCLDTIVGYSFIYYYYHFDCETTILDSENTEEDVTEICEIQLLSATLLWVRKMVPSEKSIQLIYMYILPKYFNTTWYLRKNGT